MGFKWVGRKQVVLNKYILQEMVDAYTDKRSNVDSLLLPDIVFGEAVRDYVSLKRKDGRRSRDDLIEDGVGVLRQLLSEDMIPDSEKESVKVALYEHYYSKHALHRILRWKQR